MLGGYQVTLSSEVTNMSVFTYRKRAFLNPVSTGHTSFILAEVESSHEGYYQLGHYMLTLADCYRRIHLHFPLCTVRNRRRSLAKINMLLNTLTRFRDALAKEIELIENYDGSD
jgi:hypothetical protein